MSASVTPGLRGERDFAFFLQRGEIVNPRGDKTTVYKLADGTYMDREERPFTYNGTDTWTDENGTEWNEVAKD